MQIKNFLNNIYTSRENEKLKVKGNEYNQPLVKFTVIESKFDKTEYVIMFLTSPTSISNSFSFKAKT